MTMLTLNQLPIDIITDILSRFPAKTAVSLKIVCKFWCKLISDDEFVHVHVDQSLATKTNLHHVISTAKFYLKNHFTKKKNWSVLYSADFDTFDNPIDLSPPFKNCKTPVGGLGTPIGLIGSCRGLLLLRVNEGHMMLYNPTTQTYNELPVLHQSCALCAFGFGYDSVLRDWKCVRIMQVLNTECEVMVYSLSNNCWKKLVDVPCFSEPCNWGIGALVHEVIHWAGINTIVTFNLRDEKFSCLSLPSLEVKSDDYLYVGDLDACLCLLANCYLECNVWIMKEYGVAESWTKMFRFEKHRWESLVRPVSLSTEKEKLFVLTSLQKLAYINLHTMELTDVMLTNCDSSLGASVYVENILKLDCPEDNRIIKKQGKGKNKKKNRRSNY